MIEEARLRNVELMYGNNVGSGLAYAISELTAEIRRLQEQIYQQEQKHIKDIKALKDYAKLTDLDIQVALDGMP